MEAILNLKTSENPEEKIIRVHLNEPQMMVQMISANETVLFWGRGTGKSTKGGAPYIARVATAMPGHLGCWLGIHYNHLETNVIPKLLLGLNELGYQNERDYCFGKPPKKWGKCLYPLQNWDRTMTWKNGSSFQQISSQEPGSANAFDFQSFLCDEAKFHSQKRVEGEVLPAMRGFDDKFGHLPEYLSKMWMTDKYGDYIKLKWLLDKRKKVDHDKVMLIYQLQLKMMEFENALPLVTKSEQKKVHKALAQIRMRLNLLRKDLTYVSEASAEANRKNLGETWWKDQQDKGEYEFKVAVNNEDPTRSENGFYPGLEFKHQYAELYPGCDYDRTQSLIIAMDYQASIAPLGVFQLGKLPWEKVITLNAINEFYAKHPRGLEDAVDAFCNHYAHHPGRAVTYVYDNTAIGRRAGAKKVKDIVVDAFIHRGWNVHEVYTVQGLEHHERYQKIKKRMEEKGSVDYYPFRFNKVRCPKMLISMQGAGTKVQNNKTKKNKEYENTNRYPDLDQSETTHFSEVLDQMDYAVNEVRMVTPGSNHFSMPVGLR